ncbi:MAG: MBOAT family O-acyltransferase [Bernardetiaceae bacterium]
MFSAFQYIPEDPLLFTHLLFWLLFAGVLLVYQFIHHQASWRNAFLFVFSLYFYYLSSGWFFFLLIFSTLIDYYIGWAIFRNQDPKQRKFLVTLSVVINLSVLAYFKYTFFFVETINELTGSQIPPADYLTQALNFVLQTDLPAQSIILPVGISFFTFQTISYSVDIYRRRIEPVASLIDFGFYVSFFPQLVAGPIVRASEFVGQIRKPYRLDTTTFNHAIFLILSGLIKKMLISDYISGNYVDRVFGEPLKYTGFENLMAVYGYSLQIYCDFSGYTDVAIGVALLLGFRLPLNFNSPYKAISITDFWRRWHISLSSWLRDYLYIPLGGNRQGRMRTYINLALTMLLGGLWHGAAWRFVIWGALHGVALAIHKIWKETIPQQKTATTNSTFSRIVSIFVTFHFVAFCWIFFRASSLQAVGDILAQIGTNFRFDQIATITAGYSDIYAVMLLGFVLHWLPQSWKDYGEATFAELPDFAKALAITLILLLMFQIETTPFIYFAF